MDYALPHADVFRGFKTRFDTTVPCQTNLLGAKGVGELGTIGATPAVVNAVIDALAAAGVPRDTAQAIQMPLTAPVVWQPCNQQRPEKVANTHLVEKNQRFRALLTHHGERSGSTIH